MTETKMSTVDFLLTLRLARRIYAKWADSRAYDVEQAREKGFRPAYCIHGTFQWTEYDNICGGCEDGITLLHMAVLNAASRLETYNERLDLFIKARSLNAPMDHGKMTEWVTETIAVAFTVE